MAEAKKATLKIESYYPGDWVRPRDNGGQWMPLVDVLEVYTGHRATTRKGVYDLYDAPVGVQLRVEEALKSEPLLVPERDWEGQSMQPLWVWQEDGRYHMLYQHHPGVCYAVSDDGYHWTRPELSEKEFKGSKRNNLLANATDGPGFFEDPTAPPEERFKAMTVESGYTDAETGERLDRKEGQKCWVAEEYEGLAYRGRRVRLGGAAHIVGWTSPDRLHWKHIEEPLAHMPMDGGISAHYDPDTGTYFCYCRIHGLPPQEPIGIGAGTPEVGLVRRAIGLTRTKDFRHWPPPKLVLHPDAQDDLGISFYGSVYFPYPGRRDLHCLFVQVYHQVTDHVDTQIAFSRDGLYWYRPERRAIIPVGPLGSGDEGMVYSWSGGLVELPDGYWASLYGGSSWLHNSGRDKTPELFPHQRPGQIRWARWLPHRFCGIEAENEGRFTIPTVTRTNNELRLNYRCKPGGWVKVELLRRIPSRGHLDVDPMLGFTFEECDRLTGDSLDQVVTWKGESGVSGVGEMVAIRVKMFQAKLFAYRV